MRINSHLQNPIVVANYGTVSKERFFASLRTTLGETPTLHLSCIIDPAQRGKAPLTESLSSFGDTLFTSRLAFLLVNRYE